MLSTALYLLAINSGFILTFAQKIKLHPSGTSLEAFEHDSYAITCESQNAQFIRWHNPSDAIISDKRNKNKYVERNSNSLQLVFADLTERDNGVYTCKTDKNSSQVRLTVIRRITFKQTDRVIHVQLGQNVTIVCEPNSSPPAQVTWLFNGSQISGNDYRLFDSNSGLYITNVQEDKLGTYTCKAILTTELSSDVGQYEITVKLAIIPKITSIYPNNTIHALRNSSVRIVCKTISDPSADFQWYRNGKKLHLGETNASIEQKDKESILKMYFSNPQFLGLYTCKATNKFGSDSVDFTLAEGVQPNVPIVNVREPYDTGFRFDIYQSPPLQNLTNFRIIYNKLKDNDSEWKSSDFALRDSDTTPYSLNDLEPNTAYLYKVGACTFLDLCAYTNESVFETAKITTGSANSLMRTILTQCIILLPAFFISFYTQRHQ